MGLYFYTCPSKFYYMMFAADSLDAGNSLFCLCEIYKENLTSQFMYYVGKAIWRWQLWIIFVEPLET